MKTTIRVDGRTRNRLRYIGKKCQTYDQLINELIEAKLQEKTNFSSDVRLYDKLVPESAGIEEEI